MKLNENDILTQSSLVTKHCLLMGCADRAKGISIFLSRPNLEVQTTILYSELVKKGITVFVPFISSHEHRQMKMVALNPGEDIRIFAKDKWGIPQVPSPETRKQAEPKDIDIIFTPGVAFDLLGRRLGNGKGFYDIFFKEYDKQRAEIGLDRVLKYGLALEEMIVQHVPVGDHDVALDGIVTPHGVISSMHM